ncbi:hypothetical protein AAFF_G00279370 [Aldrovandia affinis]|uniref:Uncharacterized protein n=1 Tax=Aldrovandia affinis TaxID=143900 RepID=A0AAD7SRM0_9TELE|nr:hypothetical protein AAFF_G00279370 [Aldrovandia affinis]
MTSLSGHPILSTETLLGGELPPTGSNRLALPPPQPRAALSPEGPEWRCPISSGRSHYSTVHTAPTNGAGPLSCNLVGRSYRYATREAGQVAGQFAALGCVPAAVSDSVSRSLLLSHAEGPTALFSCPPG